LKPTKVGGANVYPAKPRRWPKMEAQKTGDVAGST
jgi:hypothetical protein